MHDKHPQSHSYSSTLYDIHRQFADQWRVYVASEEELAAGTIKILVKCTQVTPTSNLKHRQFADQSRVYVASEEELAADAIASR